MIFFPIIYVMNFEYIVQQIWEVFVIRLPCMKTLNLWKFSQCEIDISNISQITLAIFPSLFYFLIGTFCQSIAWFYWN